MDALETWEHAGYTCELHYDPDPMSPDDWDTLGEIVAFSAMSRSTSIGTPAGSDEEEALDRGGARLLSRYLRMAQGLIIVPIWFETYGAAGSRMYESDDPNGYICTTRQRCEELGVSIEDAEDALRGEINTWNDYLQGQVYGFVVRDADGNELDSCWGFYPDKSTSEDPHGLRYVRAEAEDIAGWLARQDAEASRYQAL